MGESRRKFDRDFREGAVRLVRETGRPVPHGNPPITVFQRTASQDTTLGGQEIKAGQRVGLFYRSANFDEEVFDHPERFDILRNPPHLGYGGLGTHCLGASLAKLEIELIFTAIADAMPGIAKAGDPVRLRPAGSTASRASPSPTVPSAPHPHAPAGETRYHQYLRPRQTQGFVVPAVDPPSGATGPGSASGPPPPPPPPLAEGRTGGRGVGDGCGQGAHDQPDDREGISTRPYRSAPWPV